MAQAGASNLDIILQAATEQLHPDAADFVGRGFVRAEVTRFLAVQNRMLVLVGPPGVGKTALALDLVRASRAGDNPYLAHFCGVGGQDNPYTFCAALAEQLADRLGANYSLPETTRRQTVNLDIDVRVEQAGEHVVVKGLDLNIGGMHPREAFRQVVREPLRAYNDRADAQQGHAPLVVIVDALDRAWEWDGGQGGNIVSILSDVQELPPWVTLICTARPGTAVQALRERGGVQVFEIEPKSPDNLADIATFLRERFIGAVSAGQLKQFAEYLAQAKLANVDTEGDPFRSFIQKTVAASEGNFLYVRRYIRAWRNLLAPDASQQTLDPAALLCFDDDYGSLDRVLNSSYATIYADLRSHVDADVMVALAVAFAPVNLALIELFTGRPTSTVVTSLTALLPMLEQRGTDEASRVYLFYYRGFADYVRAQNTTLAREVDRRAAHALESIDRGDAQLRDYSRRFRWSHLLRGLDLRERRSGAEPARAIGGSPSTTIEDATVEQVVAMIPDPVFQARLLRELAARALQPSQTDQPGSWANALHALTTAELGLRRSRALLEFRRHGRRAMDPAATPALIEYERTLIALGDAYSTIVQRVDAGVARPTRAPGIVGHVQVLWDYLVQAPVTLYLLLVLMREGVREFHLPGVLQNLGRSQDWTVARLCVLSVSAYRRARELAADRGTDDADDINERLARLYSLMGAFNAAAATYESLLSRPAAMMSLWRQAVWRLALGEMLVAQHASDRAVEVLTSALSMFKQQDAPVVSARALSALAVAYYQQATEIAARGDPRAAERDDQAIATSDEALVAWGRVTQLPDDAGANVDPALAITRIGHDLWRMSDDPRMGSEQQRAARVLLDSIAERHYPQRFEHPILRLFKIGAAALLPLVILAGLLVAVQIPSTVEIRQHSFLPLRPPLLDLQRYPNPLVDAPGVIDSNLDADLVGMAVDIGTQIELSEPLQMRSNMPALNKVALGLVLRYLAGYLLAYMICGLLIIMRSQPARLQSRLPGRLILSADGLRWRGAPARGSWKQTWTWVAQTPRSWAAGLGRRVPSHIWTRVERRWPRAARLPLLPPDAPPAAPGASLLFTEFGGMVALERRLMGYVLHDLSLRVVQPIDPTTSPIAIYGTVAAYEELCHELERRAPVPVRHFGMEIIRSVLGACFSFALLYALLLLMLLLLWPGLIQAPLFEGGFSLSHLYVLITPGLLLPFAWWFIARPLGATGQLSTAVKRLVLTALITIFLTITVGRSRGALLTLGLKPDLATPVLAFGCLMALVAYGPIRGPARATLPPRSRLLRGGIAALATLGLLFVVEQISVTVVWYDALVRGNLLVERALRTTDCADQPACKADLDAATRLYGRAICLGPGDSDGYALRGFAYLAQRDVSRARTDFAAALNDAPSVKTASGTCRNWLTQAPFARSGPKQSASAAPRLQANLGSTHALQARQALIDGGQPDATDQMQQALVFFAQSLDLRNRPIPSDAGQTWLEQTLDIIGFPRPEQPQPWRPLDGVESLNCMLVAQTLFPSSEQKTELNLLDPPSVLGATKAGSALQFADACYSWGAAETSHLAQPSTDRPMVEPAAAWQNLAAAVHVYQAVAAADTSPENKDFAARGSAAGWFTLGQVNPAPAGAPDRTTRALHTMAAYGKLVERASKTDLPGTPSGWLTRVWSGLRPTSVIAPDEQILAAQAWSAIQLGAWAMAREPLAEARLQDQDNPLYPALDGLVDWLDSTEYPSATKEQPSPEWSQAIRAAVADFDRVIALGGKEISRAYVTRSALYVSLRDSPRGTTYQDGDYAFAMRQAIADMDRALIEARLANVPEGEQVAYRYWRGRIAASLAFTLQGEQHGSFTWAELVSLYGQALNDFESAMQKDRVADRSKLYRSHWRPWAQTMLANAVRHQQAQEEIERQRTD